MIIIWQVTTYTVGISPSPAQFIWSWNFLVFLAEIPNEIFSFIWPKNITIYEKQTPPRLNYFINWTCILVVRYIIGFGLVEMTISTYPKQYNYIQVHEYKGWYAHWILPPSKHEMCDQCWLNVATVDQHWANNGTLSCVCWERRAIIKNNESFHP